MYSQDDIVASNTAVQPMICEMQTENDVPELSGQPKTFTRIGRHELPGSSSGEAVSDGKNAPLKSVP